MVLEEMTDLGPQPLLLLTPEAVRQEAPARVRLPSG